MLVLINHQIIFINIYCRVKNVLEVQTRNETNVYTLLRCLLNIIRVAIPSPANAVYCRLQLVRLIVTPVRIRDVNESYNIDGCTLYGDADRVTDTNHMQRISVEEGSGPRGAGLPHGAYA